MLFLHQVITSSLLFIGTWCYIYGHMTGATSFIKQYSKEPYYLTFRTIMYDHRLHWGAKCYLLALLDLSANIKAPDKVIARKFHVSAPQVYRWRKETRWIREVHVGWFSPGRPKKWALLVARFFFGLSRSIAITRGSFCGFKRWFSFICNPLFTRLRKCGILLFD